MDPLDLVVLPSSSTWLTLPPEIWRLVLRSFSSSPNDLILL